MKRKGFTLIELMVVIAIIIILAAIAIPNYLRMTERAKKSRLAADFATLATVLETFKTDWGIYPIASSAEDVSDSSKSVYKELAGTTGTTNSASTPNAVGEYGPISYIKAGTLNSMKNPFIPGNPVSYISTTTGATGWVIYAKIDDTASSTKAYFSRTSSTSAAVESASIPGVPTS